jgi:hypothetical protein
MMERGCWRLEGWIHMYAGMYISSTPVLGNVCLNLGNVIYFIYHIQPSLHGSPNINRRS